MSKLDGLHPDLRAKAEQLKAICKAAGLDIVFTQGLRSMAEQEAIYAQGRTKPGPIVSHAKPGQSYHNYGLAFDIAIVKDGRVTWDDKVDVDEDDVPDYVEVGEIGEQLGMEWGGRWKRQDLPHFQLSFGLSIQDLQTGKRPPVGGVDIFEPPPHRPAA